MTCGGDMKKSSDSKVAPMKIYAVASTATDWLCDSIFLPSIRQFEPEANISVLRVSMEGNGDFGSPSHKTMRLLRLEKIPQWIEANMGEVILVSDVDIRYLRPFIAAMKKEMADADMAFQRESIYPEQGANMGQMLIRCSSRTLGFFTSLLKEHLQTGEQEQAILNRMLKATELSIRLLNYSFSNTNMGFFHDVIHSFHTICTAATPNISSMQLKRQQFDTLERYLTCLEKMTSNPSDNHNLRCNETVMPSVGDAVCINLKRRPVRWQAFHFRATEVGLGFINRFDAIDGNDLDLSDDLKSHKGTYGCLYSHAAVYKEALKNGHTTILVTEDDCVFSLETSKISEYLAATLGKYSWIHLGGTYYCAPHLSCHHGTHMEVDSIMNTHAYVIDKALMLHYIDYLDKNPFPKSALLHSDRLLLYLCQQHSLKICIPPSALAWQDKGLPRDVQWGVPQ
jgi:hypothetical protein